MFHGLTMVNFDGQTQNQMMVRPWSTMVDHGQPWSDGQTVAGVKLVTPSAFVKRRHWKMTNSLNVIEVTVKMESFSTCHA